MLGHEEFEIIKHLDKESQKEVINIEFLLNLYEVVESGDCYDPDEKPRLLGLIKETIYSGLIRRTE